MKSFLIVLSTLLLFACEHQAPTPPDDSEEPPPPQWAMFGKNLRHTANAADPIEYYSGPQQGTIAWSWKISGLFTCSPSVGVDGTIYIASSLCDCVHADSGFVYAVNPDGTLKWRFRTDGSNFATGALGQDGTYFYPSYDKHLYAIDRNGNLKWKRKFSFFETEARPAISEAGEVIVAVAPGVTALDSRTGETIWHYEAPTGSGFGVSIARNGTIYTGTENSLLALTPTGARKWEMPLQYGPQEVVIAYDGTIYFHRFLDSLLYALDPDGGIKWTFNLQGHARNNIPSVDLAASVYALNSGTIHPRLYRLDSDGNVELEIDIGGYSPHSNPLIDREGTIYLPMLAKGGDFWVIDKDGRIQWGVTIEAPYVTIYSKPAMASDGTLYVAGDYSLNAIR